MSQPLSLLARSEQHRKEALKVAGAIPEQKLRVHEYREDDLCDCRNCAPKYVPSTN